MASERTSGNKDVEVIVREWRKQMQKGYLKLFILYTLSKQPLHGYEIIKRIKEVSFGLLSPTAGGVYPALKELEEKGLIEGKWMESKGRKIKVYEITEVGRQVFQRAAEKHLDLIYTARIWIFRELIDLGLLEETELPPPIIAQAIRVLLSEKEPISKKIEALINLRESLKKLSEAINTVIANIGKRIEDIKREYQYSSGERLKKS